MRTMSHIVLLCCAYFPFSGQAQTMHIAGSVYPVEFVDVTLSVTNQQRIAADLTIVFSFAPPFEGLKGKETETGVFQLKDETMLSLKDCESISVADQNNQKSIRVGKPLSDKYLQAFTWMDANSNTVQKAHEFVVSLNNPDLLTQPLQALLDMCHTEPLSLIEEDNPPEDADIRATFAKDFFPYKYPGISALNFYRKEVSGLDGGEIPLVFLFVIDKTDSSIITAFPVGFHKGKWGFGSFPTPN